MYTVLIDESGDTGLNNVKCDPSSGPTQYFCLSAVIFNEENREQLQDALSSLPFKRENLHAQKLKHFEKTLFCRNVAALPFGMLGVVSNKLTLMEYLSDAKKTPTHFYNKCMQYLLERVAAFVASFGVSKDAISIVLEARNQKYDSLISFIQAIQQNPFDSRAELLRKLNSFSISNAPKKDDQCFAFADLAANALFCAVRRDPKAFGLSEAR